MKCLLISLSLSVISICTHAQIPSIQWAKCYGGSDADNASAINQTSDGGYIVCGQSRSNDGDVTSAYPGSYDYWITKLSPAGSIVWQKALGGSLDENATSIQQTFDGGYIVSGSSYSDDGDVTGHHGITGYNDYWIAKLSSTGSITWQRSLGGANIEQCNAMHQTSDSGFILAGFSRSADGDITGNHGGSDYWVVKLSSSGIVQWQKSLGGGTDDYAYAIEQTFDGGYIVAGASNSWGGDVTGNNGGLDYWVVKLSPTGSIVWQKSLGGSEKDIAMSIKQTYDSGYIVTGLSFSNDSDVTGHHGMTMYYADIWTVKLNSLGAITWQKSLGGSIDEYAYSVLQTPDSGYVITGFAQSADGDVSFNHGSDDFWMVKLSPGGTLLWQKTFGGSANDNCTATVVTADGGFIMAGASLSNSGDASGNHGSGDVWVVKLADVSLGVQNTMENEFLEIYPNPANSELTITSKDNIRTIDVISVPGKVLYSNEYATNKATVDVSTLPTGIYFVRINGTEVRRFLKE